MIGKLWIACGIALAALTVSVAPARPAGDPIARALADPLRPADDRKLDEARKPAQIIAFARVRRGEKIAEYLPGGGYYTRLLSDIVGPRGHIYALETTTWGKDNIEQTLKAVEEPGRTNVSLDLTPLGIFHLPEKVDLFWTTINYHDLHIARYAKVDIAAFNRAVFQSLKPGGIYFIVDHQAAPGTGVESAPKLHRIEEVALIREVEAAGFKLAGESNVLRNPADDHSKTVFDPSIRFHTDQFVLKFRRP